jgi:hypothetical protein
MEFLNPIQKGFAEALKELQKLYRQMDDEIAEIKYDNKQLQEEVINIKRNMSK